LRNCQAVTHVWSTVYTGMARSLPTASCFSHRLFIFRCGGGVVLCWLQRDMRTGIDVPAKTSWTQKADKYSYSKQSTYKRGDFADSVTQKDYADLSDFTVPRAPTPILRHVRSGKKGRSKMKKLGYTSQVANCVFNQGETASIRLGTVKGFPKHSEMSSQSTCVAPLVCVCVCTWAIYRCRCSF
jgi:hypothetical protein